MHTAATSARLHLNDTNFRHSFPHAGFKVEHSLAEEQNLQLPRLVELARRLDPSQVEYYSGKVGLNQDSSTYPKNGLSIVETVRRIEECESWMVLKHVEADPPYGALLRGMLDEVYGRLDGQRPPAWVREPHREAAFIFISSPNSVTPYHVDDEHNFLLQIRGSKKIQMWDVKDRVVMPETAAEEMLECWHSHDYQRYLPYEERFAERAQLFEISPGEGLHFPFGAPHAVQNGPAVSISFSITYRSLMCEQRAMVYYLNRRLRRMGLNPTPPEKSGWKDSLKCSSFLGARKAIRLLSGRHGGDLWN